MEERRIYEVGDIVRLKKQHPCGSSEWEILRVGADFRLKCMGCGHQIMVPRKLVEKNTRELRRGQRPKGGNSMNKYELALVVNAKIEDDARTATVEKAKEYITRCGGTITNVDEWGKKKLAYDIQKMSEAFYYFIAFDAEPGVPAEIEQNVRIMDNVLRFLCVRQEEA